MKRKYILFAGSVFSVAVLASTLVFFNRDALAGYVWRNYRAPGLALAFVRGNADLAMEIGNYYFNGGAYNFSLAKKAYEKALAVRPGILWGHYQLSRIYFVEGNFSRSLEEINDELAANPENLRTLYVRGLIYGYRNYPDDLEKAESDFRHFTLWAPKEWAGYNDLAWILSTEGKYREAEKTIIAALQNVPDAENNPWLWNSLGVAKLNVKEKSRARAAFEKARAIAATLTEKDWNRAYPGNNPASSASGIKQFQAAIEENLRRTGL